MEETVGILVEDCRPNCVREHLSEPLPEFGARSHDEVGAFRTIDSNREYEELSDGGGIVDPDGVLELPKHGGFATREGV